MRAAPTEDFPISSLINAWTISSPRRLLWAAEEMKRRSAGADPNKTLVESSKTPGHSRPQRSGIWRVFGEFAWGLPSSEAADGGPLFPLSSAERYWNTTMNPQHLLIIAYARLFALPERNDGSKLTTVISAGHYDIRLAELPSVPTRSDMNPLWVELYDRDTGRVVDSAGCQELEAAGFATEIFLAEAQSRNAIASRYWSAARGGDHH
jgi:hypothetical protein